MPDAFLFSRPFTFLACSGMSEIREGIDALESLPGHMFWLENEDFIRRFHAQDFLVQSRSALEGLMPGGAAFIDSRAEEIRRSTELVPALQNLDSEVAAAAHSYCYWRYSADVLGRSQGIPRSAIERQFDRAVASRDGAHKLQWFCPCCNGQAHYQVDGFVASQRPARQGGFSLECRHCGHRERLYAGFLHAGRLECQCAVCAGFVQTLAGQLQRPARKLLDGLKKYSWKHAVETVAEIRELEEVAVQRLARGEHPSENAIVFAKAVQVNPDWPVEKIIVQIDPTLDGRLEKNPRVWTLLCELLQQGVLDCDCEIYDQEGREQAAMEIALLEGAETESSRGYTAQEQLKTLLIGYQPSDRGTFVDWLQALKRLRLCVARFNTAVDVLWKPSHEHCRILIARQQAETVDQRVSEPKLPPPVPELLRRKRPVYLDAELEAVRLLQSLGYVVFSPEEVDALHGRSEDII